MNREVCEHFNPVDLPCAKCAEKRKSEAMFLADELEAPLGTIRSAELHRRAASELRRQHGEIESMRAERLRTERRLLDVHAQRDALLEALKSTGLFLHHCWCDVQMNDYSFEKLNRQMEIVEAVIKAAEGEKT